MSQSQPAPSSAFRTSKRKRAQVNYYEGVDTDIEDINADFDLDDLEEYSQSKKRKAVRPSRPLPKRKIFPFLELPAEVRNMIYGYALSDPLGVNLVPTTKKWRRTVLRTDVSTMRSHSGHHYGYRWGRFGNNQQSSQDAEITRAPQPFAPSLLAVNQQIYKEGRDFLYGNDFTMADPLTLHSFIVNIGPRAAALLKTVTLANWGRYRGQHKAYNHASFAALTSATNLERLSIHGQLYTSGGPKGAARQIYRDGFPWLEAVGAARGKVDAAVDLVEVSPNNFTRYWYRGPNGAEEEEEATQMQQFRAELRQLLGAHMKRIRATPVKKVANKADVEL